MSTSTANRFTVLLVVTNSCNLHCKYCYEQYKDSARMPIDLALSIAEKELAEHPNENVVFDIFGGEPFIMFDMLKEFCEKLWESYPERDLKVSCITNGTLITDNIASWLKKNSHRFITQISLDGTPEMHETNRGEAFPSEAAKLFAETWPGKAGAKMTVSKETVGSFFDGVTYLSQLGLLVNPSLARGLNWDSHDLYTYKRELNRLVEYYSARPDLQPISIFEKSIAPVLDPEMHEGFCAAGYSMCAYTPQGKKYPCQMFIPISLDSEKWSEIENIDLRADRTFYTDQDCINCSIRNLCKKCPGLNFKERGHIGMRDKRMCEFTKAEVLAVSKYKVNTLLQKDFNDLTKEDYHELKAAKQLISDLS